MTSVLNVDSIADKAGTGPVGLTKQVAAKAWWHVQFYTPSLPSSFNVSSLTDNGAGNGNINLTSALDSSIRSSGACLSGVCVEDRFVTLGTGTNTASSINFKAYTAASAAADEDAKGQITGDLA